MGGSRLRQGQPLTRTSRVFGTVYLSVLALVCLGWIVRDLSEANNVTDVWWLWSGVTYRAADGVWVGSGVDFALLMIYVISAAVVIRSSSAAGILAGTGVTTVALRLPSLWTFDSAQLSGIEDSLRTQTQVTTFGELALGLALVITVLAGRQPAEPSHYDLQVDRTPRRPEPGLAVTAALLLGFSGLTIGAWQVYSIVDLPWEVYEESLVGDQALTSLLDVPPAWQTWTIVLLCFTAVGAALARATFARPLGLVAAGLVLIGSIYYIAGAIKQDLLQHFTELPTEVELLTLNQPLLFIAAIAVLFVLSRTPPGNQPPYAASGFGTYGGYGDVYGGYRGYGDGPRYGAPPPPPPPGW